VSKAPKNQPSEAYAWYVVGLLTLVYVLSFVDRQILSLMVSDLKSGLALDRDWQVGFLMGPAFAIFYTLFGFPFGRLADTANRSRVIALGLGVWSLMTLGCGVTRNFWQMAAMRVGVGVGEASLSPSAYSIISDSFEPGKIARAISVYASGIYLGSGLAFMIGGRVVASLRGTEAWVLPIVGAVEDWQKVFWIVGLPGLVVVPIVLWTLTEPDRRGLAASKAGAGPVVVPLAEVLAFALRHWKALATHHVGFALISFSSYGSTAWLPSMFQRVHGWDVASFGLVFGMIVFVGSAGGAIAGGILADALARRGYRDSKVRVGWMAAIAWFPFGIAFPLVDDGVLAMSLVAPAAFLSAMPFGVAAAAIQELTPNELRGQISSLYLFVINLIGLAIGPLVIALFTDYVFTEADYGVAGIRWSLLSTTTFAHIGAAVLLGLGLAEFRGALDARVREAAGIA
jgi:MFS family permease